MPEREAAIDDRLLVTQAQAGDDASFEELVRRHHVRTIALCASLLPDRASAEDAAQEAFIKAYQALPRFRGDSAFSTWLYRIAHRCCIDRIRSDRRHRADSLEVLSEIGREPAAPNTGSREQRVEDRDLLERLLKELPDMYRTVLLLREGQGLTYEEICDALDCSLDSVKARLKRARQALREAMDRLEPSEGKTLQ